MANMSRYGKGVDIDGRHCGRSDCPICNNPRGPRELNKREQWLAIERQISGQATSWEDYNYRIAQARERFEYEYEYQRRRVDIMPSIVDMTPGLVISAEDLTTARESLNWIPEAIQAPVPKPKEKQTLGRVKSKFKDDGFLDSLLNADQPNQEEVNETVGVEEFQSLLKAND